jgi:hypothetical protein
MRAAIVVVGTVLGACGSVKGESDAAVGSDAAATDDAPVIDAADIDMGGATLRTCGDTFEAGAVDLDHWVLQDPDNTPVPVSVVAGRLRINVVQNAGAGNGVRSTNAYPFAGSTTQLQLVTVPTDPEVTSSVTLQGTPTPAPYIAFVLYSGGFISMVLPPAAATNVTTSDKHLRIRENAGTTYMETSADGSTWTVRRMGATPALGDVTLGVGSGIDVGTGGLFEFDNVVTSVVATSCPFE